MTSSQGLRRRVGVLIIAMGVLASACSAREARSFGDAKGDFLESCGGPAGGNGALCTCVYEKVQQAMSFDEFKKLDERLQDHPDELPHDVAALVTACAASTTTSAQG